MFARDYFAQRYSRKIVEAKKVTVDGPYYGLLKSSKQWQFSGTKKAIVPYDDVRIDLVHDVLDRIPRKEG
jgi:hypothetical protein